MTTILSPETLVANRPQLSTNNLNYPHTCSLQGTCEAVSAVNKSRLVDPNLWTVDLLVTTGVTLTAPQIHISPFISPTGSVKAAKMRSAD